MRATLIILLSLVISAGIGYAGFSLVRVSHDRWAAELADARERAAERRAEQARLAEAEAAARRAAEAAASATARPGPANPLAPSGGGFNPLGPGGGYNPLAPRPAGGGTPAAAADLHPEFGLPDTEGVEIVHYACTACHSAALFTQQHMTEARWDYTLDWMVTDQGMNPMTPEDRATTLDYLVRHFGPGS